MSQDEVESSEKPIDKLRQIISNSSENNRFLSTKLKRREKLDENFNNYIDRAFIESDEWTALSDSEIGEIIRLSILHENKAFFMPFLSNKDLPDSAFLKIITHPEMIKAAEFFKREPMVLVNFLNIIPSQRLMIMKTQGIIRPWLDVVRMSSCMPYLKSLLNNSGERMEIKRKLLKNYIPELNDAGEDQPF